MGRRFCSILNDTVDYFEITGYNKDLNIFRITMHSSVLGNEVKTNISARDFVRDREKGIVMEVVAIEHKKE
jgi:hypothetical protein